MVSIKMIQSSSNRDRREFDMALMYHMTFFFSALGYLVFNFKEILQYFSVIMVQSSNIFQVAVTDVV